MLTKNNFKTVILNLDEGDKIKILQNVGNYEYVQLIIQIFNTGVFIETYLTNDDDGEIIDRLNSEEWGGMEYLIPFNEVYDVLKERGGFKMKNLQDYIEEAIKLNACDSGIEYARQFNTLKEFVNSDNIDNIDWFFKNCKVEDEVYYLLEDKNYAIGWASYNGHIEVVRLLLQDKRVDPSADDNYAIKWASDNGHIEVVRLLLQDERVTSTLLDEELNRYNNIESKIEKIVKYYKNFFKKRKHKVKIKERLFFLIIIIFMFLSFNSCELIIDITSKNNNGLVYFSEKIIEDTIDIKILHHNIKTNELYTYFIYDNKIYKHIGKDLYDIPEGQILSNINASIFYYKNKIEKIEIK